MIVKEFIEQSIFRLRENTQKIEACLDKVKESSIWLKPNDISNSLGNQVVHLCGNIRQYIISGIGLAEDIRTRDEEFSIREGYSKAELIQMLKATVEDAIQVIEPLDDKGLMVKNLIQGTDYTALGNILHVVEHYSYHSGQIAFWTKILIEQDLGFYNGLNLNAKNQGIKKYEQFETDRIILRATNVEDAEMVLTLLNSPKWLQFIGDRNVKTKEAAEKYILDRMRPQQERLGFSNYTLIRKSDSVKLGSCGLYDREGLEGVDIGFALLPDYEKQGYGFEAANRIKQFALEDLAMQTIQGITTKDNIASQNLLKKLGFQLEGLVNLPNDPEELLLFKYSV